MTNEREQDLTSEREQDLIRLLGYAQSIIKSATDLSDAPDISEWDKHTKKWEEEYAAARKQCSREKRPAKGQPVIIAELAKRVSVLEDKVYGPDRTGHREA